MVWVILYFVLLGMCFVRPRCHMLFMMSNNIFDTHLTDQTRSFLAKKRKERELSFVRSRLHVLLMDHIWYLHTNKIHVSHSFSVEIDA